MRMRSDHAGVHTGLLAMTSTFSQNLAPIPGLAERAGEVLKDIYKLVAMNLVTVHQSLYLRRSQCRYASVKLCQ
jgi:hypothetical protein